MGKMRIRDIDMVYDEAGSGAPVVFLHGFPFNRSLWREQIELLAANYHVIAPDLPGHGETSVGTPAAATMESMATKVVALMDALRVERAAICGLSMGGYVALAICRSFPLRVRALVLADTRATADTQEGKQVREQQAQRVLKEGMGVIVEAMLSKLLAPATLAHRHDVVQRVREMMMATKPEGAAAALRGMARRADHTSFLRKILAPALIIVGEHDQITPPSDAETLHRGISGSRLEIITGAGHVSNLEETEIFNEALSKFMHDLDS